MNLEPLRTFSQHPEFRRGFKDAIATGLGVAAWGLVTGVAMVKAGLSAPLAIFMSLAVYAGSAQLAVLPLLAVGAPLWVIFLTAACVNIRFVIFSNLWRKYFWPQSRRRRMAIGFFSGDLIFVMFLKRFPHQKPEPEQLPYFWGAASFNWFSWQIPSFIGILLANSIPLSWGLGFAGVLALMGVLYSMLADKASWISTGVAASAAIAAFALPLKLNILVAIAAAVAAGLITEAVQAARRQQTRELAEAARLEQAATLAKTTTNSTTKQAAAHTGPAQAAINTEASMDADGTRGAASHKESP